MKIILPLPGCGHCKKMKPVYEKAAEAMKADRIPGMLAALDATKEPSIGAQFGVKGYPTFKYFENGVFKFDVNHRDLEGIVRFMRNPEEPPPPPPPEKEWEDEPSEVHHLTTDTYKTFLKKKKNVIVMFYAPCKDFLLGTPCFISLPTVIEFVYNFSFSQMFPFPRVRPLQEGETRVCIGRRHVPRRPKDRAGRRRLHQAPGSVFGQ